MTLSPDEWADILEAIDADEPPAIELAERFADARGVSVSAAQDAVEGAIEDGTLIETDAGSFGGIQLADQTDDEAEETAEADDSDGEEADTSTATSGGPTSFREMYLRAWERSDADQALVPHEDIVPVFEECGFRGIEDSLPYSKWTVWTPDSRETPLYAYTPDLAGDTTDQRQRLAELLGEADVGTERFIDVLDGQKASFDTPNYRTPDDEELSGNYGVKGGRADDGGLWLVDIDVDDYAEAKESNPRVEDLRGSTLGVASAHTTVERPGHLYVAVDGDPAAVVRDYLGREVDNPAASFGEIRIKEQYVVGPGSEIVCGCPKCSDPDAPDHFGRYELANEQPPVVWSEDEFRDFLEADPAIDPDEAAPEGDGERGRASTRDHGETTITDAADDRLAFAERVDNYVSDALRDASNPDDRSRADSALGRAVAPWVGYDESAIADVLDRHGTSKWAGRGSSYRSSVLNYATSRRVDECDPVPYWALVEIALRDDLVDEDELVERDSDTGEIVNDADGDTYTALPSGTYGDVLRHVRDEYGIDPGREEAEHDGTEDYDSDPREIEATVDPRRAWDAASRVTPDDIDSDRLNATDDGDAFLAPNGDTVDIVRAVALEEGLIDDVEAPLEDEYPEAYQRARDEYGAPLPDYYTTGDAIAEFDAVLDVIGELTFWHLDLDALETEITEEGDAVGGDAVRALNPAWRESESEASVLVFENGTVWDADTERVIDIVRFVALDSGLIAHPETPLEGGDFTEAYRRTRREYGAPLPRWDPATDTGRDITPQLPPSEELVEETNPNGVDPDALDDARKDVEKLLQEKLNDDGSPTVVTSLPATGKTTGTIKNAARRPLSYLAPRKELQAQALQKADEWDVEADILPVFSEERIHEEVLGAAVSHVRDQGKQRLRDHWSILSAAFDELDDDELKDDVNQQDIFVEEDDEDEVDLPRATCETAEGKHNVAWALAVHVARRLGYTPREIHTEARGLFGAPLPCSDDDHECDYSRGWDDVTDADDPADLLIGSYVHAHVESVRTKYDRGPDGRVTKSPRAVVLDEFPNEAFVQEFDEEALDFATWLATCLREDVDDRRDMYDADLFGDDWVQAWLDGEGDEAEAADAADALVRFGEVLDAREAAREIRDEVPTKLLEELDLDDPLELVINGDPAKAFVKLRDAIHDVRIGHPAIGITHWADDEVLSALEIATQTGRSAPDVKPATDGDFPFSGDLEAIVENAVEAVHKRKPGAREAIDAAVTALRGGREGCRRLAAWADDGYAHPNAHHLLRGVITPTDADTDTPSARRIKTDKWAFDRDATDGTVLDVVETTERARTVVDRNDHGALLHTPPARTAGNGDDVPVVGLDATGRRELWTNALGEDVTIADIHDTPAERAEFLEEALDLRVLQAADRPRSYEGDPESKDTDGDVALLEAIADEYGGIDAPRKRGETAEPVGKPAAITTKRVRNVLEDDPRLDDVVAEWENYGNLTGANDLGRHRLAAILGSQHYGDDRIERFCAIAGREVDTSRDGGRGSALEYGDDLANAYLKHMSEDQTMQAILRFTRGDSGATVVARTSALRDDLPVVGRGQVVETWSDTATAIARKYRQLGGTFTAADVQDVVDVGARQVRRVLAELVDAGYIEKVGGGEGLANAYQPVDNPGAGEVELPERDEAVDPGRSPSNESYTWNVRVSGVISRSDPAEGVKRPPAQRAPPSPATTDGVEPPG